jgi:hypothetical protein
LLARGLINRPAELTRLATSFWNSNRYQALSLARNRLDAIVGVLGLGIGFALQAVGYVASLAAPHPSRTGTLEALVAVALAVLCLILVLATGSLARRYRLLPLLIEMAHFTADEKRMEFPRATLLPGWLEALGHERREGEDDLAFVRRFAKVCDMTVHVTPTAEFPHPRTRRASEPPLEGEPPLG